LHLCDRHRCCSRTSRNNVPDYHCPVRFAVLYVCPVLYIGNTVSLIYDFGFPFSFFFCHLCYLPLPPSSLCGFVFMHLTHHIVLTCPASLLGPTLITGNTLPHVLHLYLLLVPRCLLRAIYFLPPCAPRCLCSIHPETRKVNSVLDAFT